MPRGCSAYTPRRYTKCTLMDVVDGCDLKFESQWRGPLVTISLGLSMSLANLRPAILFFLASTSPEMAIYEIISLWRGPCFTSRQNCAR